MPKVNHQSKRNKKGYNYAANRRHDEQIPREQLSIKTPALEVQQNNFAMSPQELQQQQLSSMVHHSRIGEDLLSKINK